MNRSSGILMSLSSLPSPYGIGTMGRAAYEFVDFLAASKQSWWQLLPLGPTTYGDSPYSSPSSFAGNPYFIDPDMLVSEGLLERSELEGIDWGSDSARVDYAAVYEHRFDILRRAFERATSELLEEAEKFHLENRSWLDTYALYMSLKVNFGQVSWTEWPDDIRLRKTGAVEYYTEKLSGEISFWIFVQFLFFRQWNALKSYARGKGIGFIGDIPIYMAMDSAEVWSEPEFFLLDDDLVPTEVAGVPPDDFTEDGQLWGNPIYDWARMKEDGFNWWKRRIEGASALFDVIRIDHFRGLASYWAVPYGDKTARRGVWREGPGMGLVSVLKDRFPTLEFIAEDLGYPTPEVAKLVEDSGFPGMNVLQFGFEADNDSMFMPHYIKINNVCYIGTHDNDTAVGWLDSLSREDLEFFDEYTHHTGNESRCRTLIRTGMASPARLFVLTMQDALELPTLCRMNTPGSQSDNWRWRMLSGEASQELAQELAHLTKLYRRTAPDK